MSLALESARLFLRQPVESDLSYFQKWLSDPSLAKYVGGVRSEDRIRQTFQFILKNWKEWGFGTSMLVWKESGEVIGSCGINQVELEGKTIGAWGWRQKPLKPCWILP